MRLLPSSRSLRKPVATIACAVSVLGTQLAWQSSVAPSSAALPTLNVLLDAWSPAAGSCTQKIAFRTVAASSGAAAPTGTVTVSLDGAVADGGTRLGAVTVAGFTSYTATLPCVADHDMHTLTLTYSGDAHYASSVTTTADMCDNEPQALPANAANAFIGEPAQRKVFLCGAIGGFGLMRSADGRKIPILGEAYGLEGGGLDSLQYGNSISWSLSAALRPDTTPTTGTFTVMVDGKPMFHHTATNDDWIDLQTRNLTVGRHSVTGVYSGDSHWAPTYTGHPCSCYAMGERLTSFTVVKGEVTGRLDVKKWKVRKGARPVASFALTNYWDSAAAAPTGRVDIYVGKKKVTSVTLRPSDHGRRAVRLPKMKKRGQFPAYVRYVGDSHYTAYTQQQAYVGMQYLSVR